MWVFCFCFSPFRLKLKVKFPRVTQHASLLILLLHVLGMLLEAPQRSAGCWLSGKGVQQYWTRNKETMWERCTNMNVCPGRIGAPEARLLLCTSNCPFKLSLIHTVPEQCKTACVLQKKKEKKKTLLFFLYPYLKLHFIIFTGILTLINNNHMLLGGSRHLHA